MWHTTDTCGYSFDKLHAGAKQPHIVMAFEMSIRCILRVRHIKHLIHQDFTFPGRISEEEGESQTEPAKVLLN